MDNRPIGIFDSGIGGMTVAASISELMPQESLLYFGDTAHLPYGDKSGSSIRHYSKEITKFLLRRNCKVIVVACNTASARAFKEVEQVCGSKAAAFNVIDPTARYVAKQYNDAKIGVIGTKGTINSRVYPRRIRKQNSSLKIVSKATPLLAPMVEEGYFDNSISRAVIKSYLDVPNLKSIKALILGCTHYPLIRQEVSEIIGGDIEIIDSARKVADEVRQHLEQNNISGSDGADNHFCVSDFTESFHKSTQIFLGRTTDLEEVRLWD